MERPKVANENQEFNEERTVNYRCNNVGAQLVCLICSEAIAVTEEYNLRRHCITHHSNFNGRYLMGSDAY